MTDIFDASPPPRVEITTATGQSFVLRNAVSCETARAIDNPVSSANLVFLDDTIEGANTAVDGRKYSDVIKLYDLAKIVWPARDGKDWHDGLYLIQRPLQGYAVNPEGPQTQFNLSLLSIGEALQRYKIFWSPWLTDRNNFAGLGFLARSEGKIVKGRPNQVILALMKIFLNDQYVFRFADGKKLQEKFLPLFDDITDSLNVIGLTAMNAEGSLFETLKRYADQPFNEFFVDVPHENAIGQPSNATRYGQHEAIYLRPTPFDADRWANLYQKDAWGFEFDGSDAIGPGEQLGPDPDGIANFVWANPKTMFSQFDTIQTIRTQTGGKVPMIDAESIAKFGARVLEQGTEYVQFLGGEIKPLTPGQQREGNTTATSEAELIRRRTEQLARWFGYDDFYSGSISTIGRIGGNRKTGARIGGIIRNSRDDREYYITGINQSWSMGSPWTTTLQLSRGHRPQVLWGEWWLDRKSRI